MATCSQANRLLGYTDDARILIINADDFGMCHSVNEAIIATLSEGLACSTTLMVPCPWALHAIHFLKDHPEIPFGVHLTAISEWPDYRWGPTTPREKVPSLVDETGYFYRFERMSEFFTQINLHELEIEFRNQIEIVLAANLKPTHLDWHAMRIDTREKIWDLFFKLAREYGLALRVRGQGWIEKIQRQGLPTVDYDFLDSYLLDPAWKTEKYIGHLRELPAGLSEWAVHPGLDTPELLAIEGEGNHIRRTDYDFLMSQQVKGVIDDEGIILLNYRALQEIWITK